ncbi:monovalent cation:proton antiporter-2 (CPA2) family protein [Cytophagaceae bacterium ABcell3]|nr:monovalent cation:proton antiporter-2 (CPA2) family protein [Cytophagaceae bacterium ABcell3]
MHEDSIFIQAIIYLAAAILAVPIAKKLGLGSVLGYLLAGILVGPAVLGLGEDSESVLHFAEFGVVMMLFVIGLELEPQSLWRMRKLILGKGGMQVLLSAVIIAGISLLFGLSMAQSIALGLILALSSTALVIQMLNEKGLMKTSSGKSAFAVLLFQDIAVIPIIALLPLLAVTKGVGGESHPMLEGLPAWAETVVTIGSIVLVVLAGKFVVPPAFRIIARTDMKELFTAAALLIVISVSVLMTIVGLSPALGAFIAGVILASSEYKHELENHIFPFKKLLLGLFFIAVGASINFALIMQYPLQMVAFVFGLMTLKGLVLFGLGKSFRLNTDHNLIFAFCLCQAGEFGFVLFSFASNLQMFPPELIQFMLAATAISMALTPLLMLVNEKFILPNIGTMREEETPAVAEEEIETKNAVIIAGFGTFGYTIGRYLKANGIEATYLDHDSDQVDLLRKTGFKVYYGDASQEDLLKSAGASEAKLLVVAVDNPEKTLEIVRKAKKYFPNLELLVRVRNRHYAYEILNEGIDLVYRENLDTSLRMGEDILMKLGGQEESAKKASRIFYEMDEKSLREMANIYKEKKSYISTTREKIKEIEDVLKQDKIQDIAGASKEEDKIL